MDAKILPYSFGADEFRDIRRRLPSTKIDVIFDVGANEGGAAAQFRKHFPSAEIHCFEPNKDLVQTIQRIGDDINVYSMALGSKPGVMGLDRSTGYADRFTLVQDVTGHVVPVDTIDSFCKEHSIQHIGYLKIDTEGHDLEVLRGAQSMLARGAIDIAQAEVSMNPDNNLHVSLHAVQGFIEQSGYRLFGLYEQTSEWITRKPNLSIGLQI
ncbi:MULTISPECIES: FkbM family methyltransferase [unclassified Bradyrhizobium]|uniref:FkbM family methyltransferase n=1 Tax=unclassified Bradyrhizobium TaxID=2631580 RepID=UPI003390E4DA